MTGLSDTIKESGGVGGWIRTGLLVLAVAGIGWQGSNILRDIVDPLNTSINKLSEQIVRFDEKLTALANAQVLANSGFEDRIDALEAWRREMDRTLFTADDAAAQHAVINQRLRNLEINQARMANQIERFDGGP